LSDQYLRRISLIVSADTKGLDLSNLRITFKIQAPDADAPPTAYIRVYNLTDAQANSIQKEFQKVTLQAGYQNGNFAVIFTGTIAQVRRGRESNIDTFVDIMAADSDEMFNFALVNQSVAKNSTAQQRFNAVMQEAAKFNVQATAASPANVGGTGGVLPRGKVLFGMARAQLNSLCQSNLCTWSVQNGQVTVIPLTGYLPGEVLKLNSRTGLIGVPEATQNGVEAMCLLNPYIKVGGRVQIDQAELNTTIVKQQGLFPQYSSVSYPASTANDGVYRVLVVEHEGDSRGNPWYSKLTCLAIDSTSPASSGVLPSG
jgi:hypothetical protein